MINKVVPVLKGLTTYFPGRTKTAVRKDIGPAASARYCYSVWLRHLTMAYRNGLSTSPAVVAELGPGDYLGVGLAALLSGANKYYALDIVKFSQTLRDLEMVDKLIDLFRNKERIPDQQEFPQVKPHLESYEFPAHILNDDRLKESLAADRVEKIKKAVLELNNEDTKDIVVSYHVPWYNMDIVIDGSVDMLFSQAVLEHVDDIELTYKTLNRWLKAGGFMSHQIDLKCHGIFKEWNAHWACSDIVWRLIRGNKPYLLNRVAHSTHVDFMTRTGFDIICDITIEDTSGIRRKQLSTRFKNIPDTDLITSGAFIQALKPK
jgi:hypothetical protein